MDAFEHIAQAAEHMRLAVAKFPQESRRRYFAWITPYITAVKIMMKLDELNKRVQRAARVESEMTTRTPNTNKEERI